MSPVALVRILGFAGDGITFLGGFLLAVKEAGEERRTRVVIGAKKALKAWPELKDLGAEMEGLPVTDEDSVEIAVARGASRISRYGARILALGFVLLLASRILEAMH